jgi:hypothetical protein
MKQKNKRQQHHTEILLLRNHVFLWKPNHWDWNQPVMFHVLSQKRTGWCPTYPVGDDLSGCWLSLPLWKIMDFVSWDDDIPNMESHKIHVPNHQSYIYIWMITPNCKLLSSQLRLLTNFTEWSWLKNCNSNFSFGLMVDISNVMWEHMVIVGTPPPNLAPLRPRWVCDSRPWVLRQWASRRQF